MARTKATARKMMNNRLPPTQPNPPNPPKTNICFYCNSNTESTLTHYDNIICFKCNENLNAFSGNHGLKPSLIPFVNLEPIVINNINTPKESTPEPKTPPRRRLFQTPPPPPPPPAAPRKMQLYIIQNPIKLFNEMNKEDDDEKLNTPKKQKTGTTGTTGTTVTNKKTVKPKPPPIAKDSDKKDGDKDDEDDENDDENEEDDEKNNDDDHHGCCDSGCGSNSDDDENAEEFFKRIINSLNNIDKISTTGPSKKSKTKSNVNATFNIDDDDETGLEYEWLGSEIKTIDDLIRIGKSYNPKKRKRHNLNIKRLNMLVEPLTELQNMIGMTDVKKIIFDQIIYYLQKLDDKNVDMLHTVIVGPPGVGKTQLTHIIAKIYNKLGFLKSDKVICAKRDDLIAEYVGQTAPKTRKVLEKALGGVLLLDEVYSLSPTSDRDFAKEAIDMINMYLSEHCHDMVCVVAGYKKPTYEKFMAQNEGLARRFTHHFEIKGYTAEELTLIFKKYVEEQKWQLGDSLEKITAIIETNMKLFPYFGGDMTTLFACCKKTHSRRLLLIPTEKELLETKKKLKIADIEAGILLFKDIKEKNNSSEEEDKAKYQHMYS